MAIFWDKIIIFINTLPRFIRRMNISRRNSFVKIDYRKKICWKITFKYQLFQTVIESKATVKWVETSSLYYKYQPKLFSIGLAFWCFHNNFNHLNFVFTRFHHKPIECPSQMLSRSMKVISRRTNVSFDYESTIKCCNRCWIFYLINIFINMDFLFRCERIGARMCGRCCSSAMQIKNSIIQRTNVVGTEETCIRQLHAIHWNGQGDITYDALNSFLAE